MNRFTWLSSPLLSTGVASLLLSGCFAPATGADELGDDPAASTGLDDEDLLDDDGQDHDEDADTDDHDGDDGMPADPEDDTGEDDDAVDPEDDSDEDGDDDTIDPEADQDTDGDDPGPIEDECLELGTIDDCLACGDTCAADGACMPEGCVAPADLGHTTPFNDNLGGPIDQFLWGFAIDVETTSYLTALGFYARPPAQAADPAGQVALYSNLGDRPHALVASTSPQFDLATGFYEQSFDGSLVLAPGRYWLMGTSTGPVPFAVNIQVNNQGLPVFPVAMVAHTFGAPLPATLQDVSLTNSHAPNFYARVLQ
jgi:hypothetical protein